MKTISENTLCQKIRVQNSWKGQIPQFLLPQAAILDSFIFRRGHPGFRTFFNFFFENGIRKYKVTNLSGDHDDLKLWPSIAHLYCKHYSQVGPIHWRFQWSVYWLKKTENRRLMNFIYLFFFLADSVIEKWSNDCRTRAFLVTFPWWPYGPGHKQICPY